MDKMFLVFDHHLINVSQIASATEDGEGLHINMIGGGFFTLPDMTITGLENRLNGAVQSSPLPPLKGTTHVR